MIFSFDSKSVLQLEPETSSAHFNHAIQFCKDWLNGKQHFVFHTSGSTGEPKTIELNRMQLEASAMATIQALQLTSNEKIFICVNTQLIAGTMMLVRGMLLNCELFLIEPSSDPFIFLDSFHQMTFASFVPMQLHGILNRQEFGKLNQFKNILVGGAALNLELEKKLSQATCAVFHTYGMTETVSHIALKRIGVDQYFSLLPHIEIKKDDRGCLCIKGAVTNNLWLITNDLVDLNDATHFSILGRVDEVINSGGVKIMPQKVEQALHQVLSDLNLPCKDLFVTSKKDNQLGEKLIAVFCCQSFSKEIEMKVKSELQKVLTKYEVPKEFLYVSSFEKTPSGKIDKLKTLERF